MTRPPEPPVAQLALTASLPSTGAGRPIASTLGAAPRTDSPELPDLVEYAFGVEPWRCAQFNLLISEFETVTLETLPRFHEVAALNARRWRIVRLLFGLQPCLPAADYPEAELRELSRLELCDELGLTRPQLKQELDAVRGAWLGALNAQGALGSKPPPPPAAPPREELNLDEDPMLKEFGFDLTLSQDEREWFIGRVRDFEKILREKLVGGMARNALMTDLRCRRLNRVLDRYDSNLVGSKEWQAQLNLSEKLADNYNQLVAQILELCPWASAIAGKMAIAPVLSIITQALQEYHAKNDTRLVDGIFTATEIQVECRRNALMNDPRYRAGWVVFLNAARAGLFDPNWKAPFPERLLGVVDAAWKAAYVAAMDAAGEPVPDLEAEGPASEYADLVPPDNAKPL